MVVIGPTSCCQISQYDWTNPSTTTSDHQCRVMLDTDAWSSETNRVWGL